MTHLIDVWAEADEELEAIIAKWVTRGEQLGSVNRIRLLLGEDILAWRDKHLKAEIVKARIAELERLFEEYGQYFVPRKDRTDIGSAIQDRLKQLRSNPNA